jgi:hypothetical protein
MTMRPPRRLAEAGLHRRLLARALEHHVHRVVGDAIGLPLREHLEVGRVPHDVGAEVAGELLAALARLDHRHRSEALSHQGGDRQRTDRAGPEDHDGVALDDLAPRDAVQRHRQRFGQRAAPRAPSGGLAASGRDRM